MARVTPRQKRRDVRQVTDNQGNVNDVVEDGFGSQWLMCKAEDCDLQVVRPGKVQCKGTCQEVGWL